SPSRRFAAVSLGLPQGHLRSSPHHGTVPRPVPGRLTAQDENSRGLGDHHLAKGLAFAFLAGAWNERELVARGRAALGDGARGRARWLRRMVRRMLVAFPQAPTDRDDELAVALAADRGLRGASGVGRPGSVRIRRWLIPEATMV